MPCGGAGHSPENNAVIDRATQANSRTNVILPRESQEHLSLSHFAGFAAAWRVVSRAAREKKEEYPDLQHSISGHDAIQQ
jgi:hypothetical protein